MTEHTMVSGLQLFTVAEVAELQHISERQVRRQIKNGELPYFRLGKAIRISRADLEVFLVQRRNGQTRV